MKLYSRQLNSLDELKREKAVLKNALKTIEEKGLISLEDILPQKSTDSNAIDTILSELTQIANAENGKDLLLSLAGPAMSLLATGAGKKTLKKLVREVFGSYVKWKAIELGYRGIMMWLDSRKKKETTEDEK